MKILELYSGTGGISKAFEDRGHTAITIDWNEECNPDYSGDIGKFTAKFIVDRFGMPDVLWAAPDCTTYTVAAISHHRRLGKDGELKPTSKYAKQCDHNNIRLIKIIQDLCKLNPKLVWFIENPRAGLQKMKFMRPLEKYKHTITYCKYQTDQPPRKRRMKPTNIWTNIKDPQFYPPCNYGDKCHQRAPRGTHRGTQALKTSRERGEYPRLLCEHIVKISEKQYKHK